MSKHSIRETVQHINTNDFILHCNMPLGYVPGLPILKVLGDELCLQVPFLKYKVTGVPDQTLVYPVRYTATMTWPEKKMIAFSNLAYDPAFEQVDFTRAIGLFRHEAVKHMKKDEYRALRDELLDQYDKVAAALLEGAEYTEADEAHMRELMQIILEPSLYPIYRALDQDFYDKYLA